MNQDVDENRNWFWKEAGKVIGGKKERCNRIKDKNTGLAVGDDGVRMLEKTILRICIIRILEKQVPVHMGDFGYSER